MSNGPAADAAGESKKRKTRLTIPAATLKRVMQADDDVGRIGQSTPAAMSRAIELFTAELVGAVVAQLTEGSNTVQPTHILAAIQSNEKLDFLAGVVDASALEASAAKKPKKTAGATASTTSKKKKATGAADDEDPIGGE